MVKFSVTIPAYKGKYLSEAIDSVLSQTYSDFELIIVDDNSPEDLKSIVDQFSDNRIRYYRNKKNCGAVNVVDNWNICLNYCTGEYVICMGDDDRLLPQCIEEYAKLINDYPGLNVYHAWTQIINEAGNVSEILEPRPVMESVYSLVYYRWSGRRQYIGDFCYKTQYLREQRGYYKLPLAWGSDDITAVMAAMGKGIANTQCPCFEYRINNLTISSSTSMTAIKLEALLLEREWFKNMFSHEQEQLLNHSNLWYFKRSGEMLYLITQKKMLSEIMNDVRGNIIKTFIWFFKCSEYEIGRLSYVHRVFLLIIESFRRIHRKENGINSDY